jgi:type I restriction enzyme, S subunit
MTLTKPTSVPSLTGKWKSYPAYKDSGVEWLGKVPEHWEVHPIWLLFKLGRGRVISNLEIQDNPGKHPVYSSQTEKDGILGYIRTYDFDGTYLTWTTDGANAGTVFYRQGKFNCTNVCGTLFPRDLRIDLRFFRHALSCTTSYYVRHDINPKLMNGVMARIRVQVPSISEQHAIATFLDRETAKINTLIVKKERLVELLQEKRAALISQAVTKGLDPTVPMKDSGVEWLGEIPAHWEVRRLKFVAKFFGGGTPSKENLDFWSGDIPWISPKDMKAEIVYDAEDHITEYAIEHSATRLIQPGAVLIVVRSGILRHSIPVAINVRPVALNQDMKALIAEPFLKAGYLASLIRGHAHALLVEWRKEGATVESIEFELLANTSCPIPPLSEQQAIVTYLDHETAKIDAFISWIREGIEKLKEYSTALISAAVTGKIDVRQAIGNDMDTSSS